MALVLIIFTAYLFLIFLETKYRPKLNFLLIIIALFAIVATISSLLGENLSHSFWSKYERMTGLLMLFHLFAFFIVLSSVFKKKEDWFKIFGVSIFVALLISIVSLLMRVDINLMGQLGNLSQDGATIGNSSFLGTYLLFNIFLALYLFALAIVKGGKEDLSSLNTQTSITNDGSQQKEKRNFSELKTISNLKIFSGISLIIIFSALLISDARAAIISLFGGLVLLFIFWLIFSKKKILKFTGVVSLVISIVAVFFITWLAFQPDSFINERLIQMGFSARLIIWEGALQGWLERPWFGWGLENFELVFAKHFNPLLFLPEYGGEVWFDRAHNIIVDILITTGILGFLTYLGIFGAAFYLLWKTFLKNKEKVCFLTAAIFSSLLVAYFVQNLTVFDMVSSFMMFFLVLAFVAAIVIPDSTITSRQQTPQHLNSINFASQRFSQVNPLIVIIILTFFSFSFFHFIIQPFRAGHHAIEAFGAQHISSEKIELYKKTLATSPLGREQIRVFFADEVINFFQSEDGKKAFLERPEKFEPKFDFLIQELEKNIKESPLDFRSHLTLGNLYIVYSYFNPEKLIQAEKIVRRAIEINSINPQSYWALTQIKLYQRDLVTAFSLAERAVEIEPRIGQSHFILVETTKFKGKMDLAKEKAKEAIKINPDWQPMFEKILNKEINY